MASVINWYVLSFGLGIIIFLFFLIYTSFIKCPSEFLYVVTIFVAAKGLIDIIAGFFKGKQAA